MYHSGIFLSCNQMVSSFLMFWSDVIIFPSKLSASGLSQLLPAFTHSKLPGISLLFGTSGKTVVAKLALQYTTLLTDQNLSLISLPNNKKIKM